MDLHCTILMNGGLIKTQGRKVGDWVILSLEIVVKEYNRRCTIIGAPHF